MRWTCKEIWNCCQNNNRWYQVLVQCIIEVKKGANVRRWIINSKRGRSRVLFRVNEFINSAGRWYLVGRALPSAATRGTHKLIFISRIIDEQRLKFAGKFRISRFIQRKDSLTRCWDNSGKCLLTFFLRGYWKNI